MIVITHALAGDVPNVTSGAVLAVGQLAQKPSCAGSYNLRHDFDLLCCASASAGWLHW